VAVVRIVGTLTQRGDMINSVSTRSTDAVAAEVREAAGAQQVDAIVLEIDSPGGEVFGVPEAWQAIREATRQKPVVAVANSFAASAAYYLASAADEIWVTPSGQVGSVGVYALHVDESAALEAMGEKWTFVSAGKYKVEGNPAEPLSEEGQETLQTTVNHYYDMFTRDVARGRGREIGVDAVRRGFGEGRMVLARPAVEERMADEIGTLDDAIRRAAQLGRARASAAKAQRLAAAKLRVL
jgi:signal peptide peptidase SppA